MLASWSDPALRVNDDILVRYSCQNLQEVLIESEKIIVAQGAGQPQETLMIVAELSQGGRLNLLGRAKTYPVRLSGNRSEISRSSAATMSATSQPAWQKISARPSSPSPTLRQLLWS